MKRKNKCKCLVCRNGIETPVYLFGEKLIRDSKVDKKEKCKCSVCKSGIDESLIEKIKKYKNAKPLTPSPTK